MVRCYCLPLYLFRTWKPSPSVFNKNHYLVHSSADGQSSSKAIGTLPHFWRIICLSYSFPSCTSVAELRTKCGPSSPLTWTLWQTSRKSKGIRESTVFPLLLSPLILPLDSRYEELPPKNIVEAFWSYLVSALALLCSGANFLDIVLRIHWAECIIDSASKCSGWMSCSSVGNFRLYNIPHIRH